MILFHIHVNTNTDTTWKLLAIYNLHPHYGVTTKCYIYLTIHMRGQFCSLTMFLMVTECNSLSLSFASLSTTTTFKQFIPEIPVAVAAVALCVLIYHKWCFSSKRRKWDWSYESNSSVGDHLNPTKHLDRLMFEEERNLRESPAARKFQFSAGEELSNILPPASPQIHIWPQNISHSS